MLVNLIVIALILLIGFHYSRNPQRDSDKNRLKYVKTICIILILQSGLRNVAVGTDTYAYFLMFEDVKTMSWSDIFLAIRDYYLSGIGKDPGYALYEKIIQILSDNYQFFLFSIAVIFFTALGRFVYKNTNKLSDSILSFIIYSVLFYSFFSITGHRQTIATAGTLYAFEFLKKRKFFVFLIIILISSTIHKTCLIFIPFYILTLIKNPKPYFWLLLICFPILLLVSDNISVYIFALTSSYEEYEHLEELKPITFLLLMLFISVIALWRYNIIIKINNKATYYYSGLMIGIFFLSLVFAIHGYMRIVQYFSIFILILIPLILQTFSSLGRKVVVLTYTITIFTLLFFFIKSNIDMEYKFFWQEMKLVDVYL